MFEIRILIPGEVGLMKSQEWIDDREGEGLVRDAMSGEDFFEWLEEVLKDFEEGSLCGLYLGCLWRSWFRD
jgi:hypothetical protein